MASQFADQHGGNRKELDGHPHWGRSCDIERDDCIAIQVRVAVVIRLVPIHHPPKDLLKNNFGISYAAGVAFQSPAVAGTPARPRVTVRHEFKPQRGLTRYTRRTAKHVAEKRVRTILQIVLTPYFF